ncbi:OmpA family protein [Algibacter mikhailovii]|uniref:OmpA family protein n=1 Tax=Algibacter mikhailovii TaxID=425498 RepID=UPI0016770D82|nr:OmpA family protein [Algibacter mikhailovii]
MIKYSASLVLIISLLFSSALSAQEELKLTSKDSLVSSAWVIGLGFNLVDDSGAAKLLNFDELNGVPFPSRLSIGRYFENGFGVELIGSYNVYEVGTVIDTQPNPVESDYFGIDSRISYDLNYLIGETAWFDPYLGVGLGYTDANNVGRATFNGVVGFRTWFSDKWGLDFNASGKWNLGDEGTNHVQYGAGVVHRFDITKKLSKKGKAKAAELERLNRDRERRRDSINRVQIERERKEEEARRKEVDEKLAAKIKEAKLAKTAELKAEFENIAEELGTVYYEFNSPGLTDELKELLDAMAKVMAQEPRFMIKVIAHTDSRGDSEYNDWLSNKRAVNAKSYLESKGISPARITSEGAGERKLVNKCSDGVPCTRDEHSRNRRTEVILTFAE